MLELVDFDSPSVSKLTEGNMPNIIISVLEKSYQIATRQKFEKLGKYNHSESWNR